MAANLWCQSPKSDCSDRRCSIDFRTVHLDDVLGQIGAPNVDSAATGTSLRDFLHVTDFSRVPNEIAELYDTEPVADGELIFGPPPAGELASNQ